MSHALKQAVKRGLTTRRGSSKFVEQTAQTAAPGSARALQLGQGVLPTLEDEVAKLNREFNVGNKPERSYVFGAWHWSRCWDRS